ncbi:hypothetical protein BYT27DRAFT_7112582 [Phlegmacium glaucopus]|nr:hypothetical protein BYT27DRAFT_7112582 [Phlegmacium glaucopus]
MPPGGRLRRVYNVQERAVMDPFKSDYLNATSPSARKTIAQVHIIPALFNYWEGSGQEVDPNKIRAQTEELLKWLRNVWRSHKKPVLIEGIKYRLTDILWWTREQDVFAEIASIMELPSANTHTPGWFPNRTIASKNVIDAMSHEEREKLDQEAERIRVEGLPVERQRKLAEQKWYSRFSTTAKERYLEMGLVSISVVAYTDKAGHFVIDIHDDIADLLGIHSKAFEDIYEDKSQEMKRTVLEYIKTLQAAKAGPGAVLPQEVLTIQLDPDRFPIAPRPASWSAVSKDDLEPMYRVYITQHYRLACQDRERQAPFQRITKKPSDFIDAQYLPNGINVNDPQSMKLEAMIKFFQHVAAREATHGVQHAFRFKAVLYSRKNGSLRAARYNDGDAESDQVPAQKKR